MVDMVDNKVDNMVDMVNDMVAQSSSRSRRRSSSIGRTAISPYWLAAAESVRSSACILFLLLDWIAPRDCTVLLILLRIGSANMYI